MIETQVVAVERTFQLKSITQALTDKQRRYAESHPISKQSYDEACKYMPGGNTRTVLHISPFPLTIESAKSCFVTSDGHEYVDFLGEYTAGLFGHNNPVIHAAINQALSTGWGYGGPSLMEQKLAQAVCKRFPAIELVRFVNSGTEASMMALATAVAYTGKKRVMIFNGGYHGSTISGLVLPGKVSVNLPHQFVKAKYNDGDGVRSLIQDLKDELAAIIIEPMMGSGGCVAAEPAFLHLLRDLTAQHGILLIFDEVMTSRLSYHGLGFHHGVKPDLMTLGKWIGGGMTFGAFGGRSDLMNMYDPRRGELQHPGTFNNNIFTMTAGVAGCELYDGDRVRRLNELGDGMRQSLLKLLNKYEITGTFPSAPLSDEDHNPRSSSRPPKMFVLGYGSMMTIHFGGPDRFVLQGLFYHHMLENGIYMAHRGFIALSLEITQPHVDRFVQATNTFCQEWQTYLRW